MRTDDLDYILPKELIAQHPSERRDESRMLIVDRAAGTIREDVYKKVAAYLNPGDCLCMNNTRVIRARLHGVKPTGGQVEVFLLHEMTPGEWEALVRPSAKVKQGTPVRIADGVNVVVEEVLPRGRRRVRFERPDVLRLLEEIGQIPLPPYIERPEADASDLRRYQTIYASTPGAVAAPTAGLHFTDEVIRSLHERGVGRVELTLHVGYGTFRPIMTDEVEDHVLEAEEFDLSKAAASALNKTRRRGGRVVAVGTTTTRVLETQYRDGAYQAGVGATAHYIYPPYQFKGVDCLQTNFHLPKSSLLALVYAFGGPELIKEAYTYAIKQRFRFYSYGDVMLIL